MNSPRQTSHPDFWDARYRLDGYAFGDDPDSFLAAALVWLEEEGHLLSPARVSDLGAGEGRMAVYAAARGHRVTAVDFAGVGLAEAQKLAGRRGVPINTVQTDVTRWTPADRHDVLMIAFVHLLPPDRRRLFARFPAMLKAGGWVLARLFRPEQASRGTFGPSKPDRLVTPDDLRRDLPGGVLHHCEARTVHLSSGRYLQGEADVVDMIWQADG